MESFINKTSFTHFMKKSLTALLAATALTFGGCSKPYDFAYDGPMHVNNKHLHVKTDDFKALSLTDFGKDYCKVSHSDGRVVEYFGNLHPQQMRIERIDVTVADQTTKYVTGTRVGDEVISQNAPMLREIYCEVLQHNIAKGKNNSGLQPYVGKKPEKASIEQKPEAPAQPKIEVNLHYSVNETTKKQ